MSDKHMKMLAPLFSLSLLGSLACFCFLSPAGAAEQTITVTGNRLPEGNSGRPSAQFRVSLPSASTTEVRVSFSTYPGTATAGRDFVSTRGTLVFVPGVREQTISIPILSDTVYERDESFFLNLTATGYTTALPAAACTILNDDLSPTPTSIKGQGKIVYEVSNYVFQIWTMNSDGTNQTCLTPEPGYQGQHDVSPDGSKIAYAVYDYATKTDDIWTMDADGSHKTRLTHGEGFNQVPKWSPDGKRIAFRSTREGDFKLYTMNANGTRPLRVTPISLGPVKSTQFSPTYEWSPEGRYLVFSSAQKVDGDIFLATSDGQATTRLTNDNIYDAFPVWSPDGSRIVFTSARDGNAQLFSVDLAGRIFQKLTSSSSRGASSASFSPDGTQIAFVSARSNDTSDIECMNSDGSGRHFVTKNNRDDSNPQWLPDGSRIVYASARYSYTAEGASSVVYSVKPSGLETRILSTRKDSYYPRPAPGFVPIPPSAASPSPKLSSAPAS